MAGIQSAFLAPCRNGINRALVPSVKQGMPPENERSIPTPTNIISSLQGLAR